VDIEIEQILRTETSACTIPDHLRWRSEPRQLASKAASILVCARRLDSPPDMDRVAQQDLRTQARYLYGRLSIAAGFESASIVERVPASGRWPECSFGFAYLYVE
jgi:hypothetical protein